VKTITIRLPDVEAAMLLEVQRSNRSCRDINQLMITQLRGQYSNLLGRTVQLALALCSVSGRDCMACCKLSKFPREMGCRVSPRFPMLLQICYFDT
jgi:hypothetical protein